LADIHTTWTSKLGERDAAAYDAVAERGHFSSRRAAALAAHVPDGTQDLVLDGATVRRGIERSLDARSRGRAFCDPPAGLAHVVAHGRGQPGDIRRCARDERPGPARFDHLDNATHGERDDWLGHRHRLDDRARQRIRVDARDHRDVEVGQEWAHVAAEPEEVTAAGEAEPGRAASARSSAT
jgi:hypothetical protein